MHKDTYGAQKIYNHHLKVFRAGSKQRFALAMHIVRDTLKAAPGRQIALFWSLFSSHSFLLHPEPLISMQEVTLQSIF